MRFQNRLFHQHLVVAPLVAVESKLLTLWCVLRNRYWLIGKVAIPGGLERLVHFVAADAHVPTDSPPEGFGHRADVTVVPGHHVHNGVHLH